MNSMVIGALVSISGIIGMTSFGVEISTQNIPSLISIGLFLVGLGFVFNSFGD